MSLTPVVGESTKITSPTSIFSITPSTSKDPEEEYTTTEDPTAGTTEANKANKKANTIETLCTLNGIRPFKPTFFPKSKNKSSNSERTNEEKDNENMTLGEGFQMVGYIF